VICGSEQKENKAFEICFWRGLSVQYQYMPVWPSRARVWFLEVAEVLVGAEAGACRSHGQRKMRACKAAARTWSTWSADCCSRQQLSAENRFSRGNAVALMVPLPLPFMRTSVCPSVQGVHTLGTGRGY
jgi:hypothetical protein